MQAPWQTGDPIPADFQPRRRSLTLRAIQVVLRPLYQWGLQQHWSGAENLPKSGGFLVCGNHISYLDWLPLSHFLLAQGCPPRFLGKQSLFTAPVLGWFMRQVGHIPVARTSAEAIRAVDHAAIAIQAGECVAMYPEGTLGRDPQLWPMVGKTGAARIALQTGCPVIPMAQWGIHEVLPPYGKWLRLFPRKTVQVWAGAPVDLSSYRQQIADGRPIDSALLREVTEAIMADITALLADIRKQDPPTQRWDYRTGGRRPAEEVVSSEQDTSR